MNTLSMTKELGGTLSFIKLINELNTANGIGGRFNVVFKYETASLYEFRNRAI